MQKLTIILLTAFVSACSVGNSGETTEDIRESFRLKNTAGESVPLKEIGDGYLFINFWATWCKPCLQEIPSIVALRDSLSSEPVTFLFVTNETIEQAGSFLENKGIDIEGYHMENAVEQFDLAGFPTTMIVGPEGNVLLRSEGAEDWNAPVRVREIRELINRSQGK